MDTEFNGYVLTDDKTRINADAVQRLLAQSYWARDRATEVIAKTLENSVCIGILKGDELVGFGRAVTDKAVFAWIADVIVREDHRGNGLGKRLMAFIREHPDIPERMQLLRTLDAHGLYERFGFERNGNFMQR